MKISEKVRRLRELLHLNKCTAIARGQGEGYILLRGDCGVVSQDGIVTLVK